MTITFWVLLISILSWLLYLLKEEILGEKRYKNKPHIKNLVKSGKYAEASNLFHELPLTAPSEPTPTPKVDASDEFRNLKLWGVLGDFHKLGLEKLIPRGFKGTYRTGGGASVQDLSYTNEAAEIETGLTVLGTVGTYDFYTTRPSFFISVMIGEMTDEEFMLGLSEKIDEMLNVLD